MIIKFAIVFALILLQGPHGLMHLHRWLNCLVVCHDLRSTNLSVNAGAVNLCGKYSYSLFLNCEVEELVTNYSAAPCCR
jgi:hypothetical protein